MLKILGRATSTNVQKVLWFCDEAGIAYAHDNGIGGAFGRNDTPEYLAMNPNGKVPTVIDGDFVMWESNSVIRYLARKHKSALYPSEFEVRNMVERWMDWELSVVAPHQGTVLVGLVRTKPEDRDNAKIKTAGTAWARGMTILDEQLAKTGHVAGDDFTLADIPLGPIAHRFFSLDIERPDLPNLRRWYETLSGRPAFDKWCVIEMA
ncbi:MAG: glutathione S-transferase [Rhodospirillaceae bacterium]|nr:glutathione S-transferase [Rhodospirillaceae bacterium]|tara:strand:- start:80 stop:700 length:621 start_codon:yes stop_codon:yes gene_type:complete